MQAHLRSLGVAVVCAGLLCLPALAHAQDQKVTAGFKGAAGLGLVGAELGAVIPALVGVEATWAYIVFPLVGAAGGAIAGHFALDSPDRAELSVGALTLGMALVIPALIVTLAATAYDPGDTTNAEQARLGPPAQRVAKAQQLARTRQRLAAGGTGMLRLRGGELAVATPGLGLVPSVRAGGDWRISGVHFSLLSGQF
jgi:hypothetical protein